MKTYIIAEAGVNHNGDVKIAHKLIEEAKNFKLGVDMGTIISKYALNIINVYID